jgi:hypothetical protein
MSGDERDVPVLSSEVCSFFTLVIHERLQYRNTLLHDSMAASSSSHHHSHKTDSDEPNARSGSPSPPPAGSAAAASASHSLRHLQRERDFSDDQTFFVVWPSAPHLVLDVQPNPAATSDGSGGVSVSSGLNDPILCLAERSGAISQKWYRQENGGYLVSCLLSQAYKKRRHKVGSVCVCFLCVAPQLTFFFVGCGDAQNVSIKPPDWVFGMKWVPVTSAAPGPGGAELVEIKHTIRLSRTCLAAFTPHNTYLLSLSQTDSLLITTLLVFGLWLCAAELSRSVYLTIDGVCCGHPDCEEPRVRAGSICRMDSPQAQGPSSSSSSSASQSQKAGAGAGAGGSSASAVVAGIGLGLGIGSKAQQNKAERVCSPLQRWCLKTEFDVFMDDLVSPVLDSLKAYRKQIQDRAKIKVCVL